MNRIERDLKKYWYITNRTLEMLDGSEIKKSDTKKLLREHKKDVKEYNKEHKEEIKQHNKEFERKLKIEYRMKQRGKKFLNKRDARLYQNVFRECYWDIKECMKCWSIEYLQIHHKDKNWKNNKPENLIMLCKMCHAEAHKWEHCEKLIASGRKN